jgi:hypothetical protein
MHIFKPNRSFKIDIYGTAGILLFGSI